MAFVHVLEIDRQKFVYAGRSDLPPAPTSLNRDLLHVDELLQERYRLPLLTDDPHETAIRALLRDDRFKTFIANPKGVFPVAVMPASLRLEFPDHQFLALSDGVAMKMRERHPDVTFRRYQAIQLLLSQGDIRYPDDIAGSTRAIYLARGTGSWWRLLLSFPRNENAAEIVTYHRVSQRAYCRQNKWS